MRQATPIPLGVTQLTAASRPRAAVGLTLRVDLGAHGALGPGKIRLLEMIDEHGSITLAGRAMGMSYRRAWLLVDSLNRMFRAPVVATQAGGAGGGGTRLTELGRELVRRYRLMENQAAAAVQESLRALEAELSAEAPAGARAYPDEVG